MRTYSRLDVVHHVAAMLGSEIGLRPERVSDATVLALHAARKIGPAVAAAAWGIHDGARSYGVEGDRLTIIRGLTRALADDFDFDECAEVVHNVIRYRPEAVCRHCLRPVVEAVGVLLDDAPRDRAYCPRALNLTHARATADDLPRMGVKA
jgi:hypothetical protein